MQNETVGTSLTKSMTEVENDFNLKMTDLGMTYSEKKRWYIIYPDNKFRVFLDFLMAL